MKGLASPLTAERRQVAIEPRQQLAAIESIRVEEEPRPVEAIESCHTGLRQVVEPQLELAAQRQRVRMLELVLDRQRHVQELEQLAEHEIARLERQRT